MTRKVGLAFVGSMLGRYPGHVTSVGEILASLFDRVGHPVVLVSTSRYKAFRLLDIVLTLVIKRDKIDIQILQVYGGLSFIAEDVASWLGRSLGHKIIMHIHGGAMGEFMSRYPVWSKRVLSRADTIVCPSAFLARALDHYGFRSQVIPNNVELSLYPYRHRRDLRPRIFWMRTFHAVYNPQMAVKTLARIRKYSPTATLVMAGQDKGELINVIEMAKQLNVESAIRFPGYLDTGDKIREGNMADIFVNTNRIDNTPVSLIEACAMGIPVVTTNVGGVPDLLKDGETGLLVPDDDDKAMAEAVIRLLTESNLADRLSANGRRLAKRFAWEQVRPQWEQLFSTIIENAG